MSRLTRGDFAADGIELLLGRIAGRMVHDSRRRPYVILAITIFVTVVSSWLAATQLVIDTDPDRLTSSDLPFRRTNAALEEAFPALQDAMVVMIRATDPKDARAAAEELADRMRADPDHFPNVFLPGDDPFYDDNGLFYIERSELVALADRMDESGPLLATLADRAELPTLIGALIHVLAGEKGLDELGPDGLRILAEVATAVEAFERGESAPIDWDALLFDDLEVEPDALQVVIVSPHQSLAELDSATTVIRGLRNLTRRLEQRPGLEVRVTGDMVVQSDEMSLVLGEVAVAGVTSLALVTVVLLYAVQSYRLLIATVLALLVGLCWTAGFAALAVGHLNVLTAAFGVLYIGLGADFGIHFALGYLENKSGERGISTALRATGRRVGSSLVFCALTTAIGFYAFIPTQYDAVAELGIISGSGVFMSLLATLTTYPALIALGLGGSEKIAKARLADVELVLPVFPLRWPATVCTVSALIVVASLLLVREARFDMNPLNVRDPRVKSVEAMKALLADEEFSAWTIEGIVDSLSEARRLADVLEGRPGVLEVRTVESFLPEDQADRLVIFARMGKALSEPVELSEQERGSGRDVVRDLRWTIDGYGVALDLDAELRAGEGDDEPLVLAAERLRRALDALRKRLPDADDETGEVARELRLGALEHDVFGDLRGVIDDVVGRLPTRSIGLADLPESLRGRYLAPDGRARIEVRSSENLNAPGALEAFADVVYEVYPEAGGPVVATVEFGRAIVQSLRQALATAVVVIVMLLFLLWRSLKYSLITIAPLFMGAVMTAAFTVLAQVPFNFANVIVLPLILGMGVDGGIHLVHRHRSGLGSAANLLRTSTARAVLFSAATTIVSFATLGFSHHGGISSLALLLTAGITFMLIANVVFLPSLLVLVDPRSTTGESITRGEAARAAMGWDGRTGEQADGRTGEQADSETGEK
jgi:hopanoid biosynthesis associated RND transporter like protein HpnN